MMREEKRGEERRNKRGEETREKTGEKTGEISSHKTFRPLLLSSSFSPAFSPAFSPVFSGERVTPLGGSLGRYRAGVMPDH